MARIDNNAKLNAFLSNDDNFEVIDANAPRAKAHWERVAKNHHRREESLSAHRANAVEVSSGFSVGQVVKHAKRPFDRYGKVEGEIVAIDGENVVIRRADGKDQKFIASVMVGVE